MILLLGTYLNLEKKRERTTDAVVITTQKIIGIALPSASIAVD